ncbi:MAG TPA: hypothetical protein VHB21_20065, partial [Minicystis sp.]|nr:hypothetical protein [Minicystis sp.]
MRALTCGCAAAGGSASAGTACVAPFCDETGGRLGPGEKGGGVAARGSPDGGGCEGCCGVATNAAAGGEKGADEYEGDVTRAGSEAREGSEKGADEYDGELTRIAEAR